MLMMLESTGRSILMMSFWWSVLDHSVLHSMFSVDGLIA